MRTIRLARQLVFLIPILLLAAFLRIYEADTEFFGGDDAYISIKAIQIARYGEIHLLGPPSSLGLVHSPLSVYLYAIPYVFSPDPRVAQIFTGLMNTVAVGVLYLVSYRYFGLWSAILGSVLYAVHPHMVFASRVINNAQLGAPLVMLYILTGLLGYYENRRWARLAHFPLLSLAGQCHPHSFALAPISVALFVHYWINRPGQRRDVLLQTVVGVCIAALTLVPWGIGLYQFSQHVDVLQTFQNMPSTGEVQDSIGFGGLGHIMRMAYDLERVPRNWLRLVQAGITITGAAWLLFRALRHRKEIPGLIIVLGLIIVPAVTWIIQAHWVVDYWWPSLPSAFLIQGAFLGAVVTRQAIFGQREQQREYPDHLVRHSVKWLAFLLTVTLVANQIIDFIFTDHPPPPVSAHDLVSDMDIAVNRARELDQGLMVLLSPGHGGLTWAFLREYAFLEHGLKAMLVEADRPLPLPDTGAVLVADARNVHRDYWFAAGETMLGSARMTQLPSVENLSPDIRALHPFRFSNGVNIHGFLRTDTENLPQAGERFSVVMIWQADDGPPPDFKFFTHLIAADGKKYGQSDRPGLAIEQWRSGALYASQFDLDLADDLPKSGELFLRFGIYAGEEPAELLDTISNSSGGQGVIQVRGEGLPVAVWSNGLELSSLRVNRPIQPGPPISVDTTWYANQDLKERLRLYWRLVNDSDFQVYSTVTDIVPTVTPSVWPQGVFNNAKYELRVPTDIAPNEYRLEMHLLGQKSGSFGEPFVTSVEVIARDRAFVVPPLAYAVQAIFGGEIELVGYGLAQNEANLELTLFWRALKYISRDYKYFVHLRQGDRVSVQFDSMPADWQYPTSWWAPGEVVSEKVLFDVTDFENDDFSVTTGFYDPTDGERLSVLLSNGAIAEVGWVTLVETSDE